MSLSVMHMRRKNDLDIYSYISDSKRICQMNLFEAGILPSIPLGAIIGGVICKSFGVSATIGGIIGGGIVGLGGVR